MDNTIFNEIKKLLKDYNHEEVNTYINYIYKTSQDPKNSFINNYTADNLSELFRAVNKEGLVFDGIHITLSYMGIQYDYIAYKNKMLLAYPETKIDIQLVYEGDTFNVAKESGSVLYQHNILNPFDRDVDKITGGYVVIKNKRGEFITILNKDEFDKHRGIAKTDFIWKSWYAEMSYKTLIRKAVKLHFSDIYEKMDEEDNKNYDLEKPIEEIKEAGKIKEIKTVKELREYYLANKDKVEDKATFNELIVAKKTKLIKDGK